MNLSKRIFALAACIGTVAFGATDIQTALDNTALTFTTGGDAEWFSQSSEVHTGTTALQSGKIADNQETWVETTVSGAGMVSFWWKVSSESENWDWLEVSVDGVVQTKIGGTDGTWEWKHVVVTGESSHTIRWRYRKDDSVTSGADCGWLDKVEWMPAPASMQVSFVVNGGGDLSSRTVYPGDLISSLPTPTSGDERVFAGWYYDAALTSRALPADVIPFRDTTLYADWWYPVSLMDGNGIVFSDEYGFWQAVYSAGFGAGNAAVIDVPYYDDSRMDYKLSLGLNGPGTLSFKWKTTATSDCYLYYAQDGSGEPSSLYYDRYASSSSSDGAYAGGWKIESMRMAQAGEHAIEFWAYNYDSSSEPRFSMCDFTWTPAPEVIRVSMFDGNAFLGSTNVVPGTTYGDLVVLQEKDGYGFLGWYADPELTRLQPMDELLPFVENLTLYAKWGISVSAMDDGTLCFENQGDIPWFVEEDSGASGGAAVVAEIPGSNEDSLSAVLAAYGASGYGTWSFKWKVEPLDKYYWTDGNFSFSVDGETCNRGSWSYGNWNEQTFRVASEGDHELMWELENWSDRPIRYLISDIAWNPAPVAMTVSFDSDGGADPYPLGYVPGDCYGELPVPTRIGWIFAGWRLGSASGEEVRADDLVPFWENVRLVASWKRSVSYMHDAGFSFRTDGEDKFYQTNVKTPTGGFFAGVTLTKYYQKGGMCVSDGPRYTDKPSSLVTTVTGPGYLTFDWMAKKPGDTSVSCSFLMDGKEVEYFYGGSGEQGGGEQVYVPSGTHTLKWDAYGWPEFAEEWNEDLEEYEYTLLAAPSLYIGDITFEKAGPQKTPAAWAGKLHDYNVFVTGDPAKFKKAYAGKIAKNANDYEARVFHAFSLLAELAENADFKAFAKTFGYTFDYTHCQFVGTPKLNSKTAAVNTMVDKAIAVAVPAMKSALADLQAIPNDWTGEVTLDAKDWPLDETLALDIADVRFARASLQASIGTLYFLGGYDLTVDWAKAKTEASWHKPLLKVPSIPSVADETAWSRIGTVGDDIDVWSEQGYDPGLEQVRVVTSGSKVAVHLTFANGLEESEKLRYADLYIRSGNTEYDLYVSSPSSSVCEPVYDTDAHSWRAYAGDSSRKISGSIQRSGNCILIVYDCSAIKDFSKKSWSLDEGCVSLRDEEDGCNYSADWYCDDYLAATQKILMEQTKFLSKVRKAAHLTTSKSWIEKALREALAADEAVLARPAGDGNMHFVEYDPVFAEIQQRARETTELALQSLSEAVTVDFPQTLADFGSEEDIDFTLLPDNGVMRVYLGALFNGKITRAMKPKTHLNDKDELIANWSALPDPTFGGLLPDVEKGHYAALAETYGPADTPMQYEPLVPGEKFSLDLSRYVGYAMLTTLPKGWTWDSKTGLLTGTATKKMTLSLKGGGMTESVTLDVGPKPRATAVIAEDDGGVGVKAVTGSGSYVANAKVKFVAAMKSGYAFGGWYDANGNLVANGASYSFTMPRTDLVLTARSVSLRDDWFELRPNAGWTDEPIELAVNGTVDSSYGAYFAYDTLSPCSISASGLPTGVKLAKVNGEYVLSGKATKKGVYYAKLSGKNNGGFKMSAILKFVVGGAKETFTNTAQIELERFEWGDPYTGYDYDTLIPVPAKNKIGTVKSIKVTGLPKGYKYKYPVAGDVAGKCLRIYGVAATPGVYAVTVSASCTNGKVAKSQRKVVVFDSGSVYMPVSLEEGSAGRGTVSGGGVKSYGSTVKLVAKPKDAKSYFFAGWQKRVVPFGGNWSPATYSFTLKLGYSGEDIYGRFVTKAEDVIAFDSKSYDWRVESHLPACTCDGVEPIWTSCPFECTSVTKPKITATGLPAGTKLSGTTLVVSSPSKLKPGHYTVKLTAKNVSGNSASATVKVVVPNLTEAVDQGIIEGLDTSDEGYEFESGTLTQFNLLEELGVSVATGWTLSVSGLPTGWTYKSGVISGTAIVAKPVTVTFKVKKGTVSKVATATFNMTGLPGWAVGTFVGSTLTSYKGESAKEEGVMTMTVTKEGKISGSYSPSGDKTPFSGSGFTWIDNGVLSATVKGKVDGKTKSFKVVLSEAGEASFSGKISSSESIQTELLKRNPWTIPGEAGDPLPVFDGTLTRSVGWTGYFKGKAQTGTFTLAFGAKGVVKVTWKTAKESSSASAQIADLVYNGNGLWSGFLVVGVAPNDKKKIAGAYCYVQFALQADEFGVIQDVVVTDEWGYDNVWSFGYPPWNW